MMSKAESLAKAIQFLGLKPDDGAVVAYIPEQGSLAHEFEHKGAKFYAWEDPEGYPIVLDSTTPRKWWQVREAARAERLEYPEPLWAGPSAEARVEFAAYPNGKPGHKLAFRAYQHGPWITL